MRDYHLRALSASGGVRILTCRISDLAREICSLQQASATVTVALGRALAAAALMEGLLKDGQRVALKFEGNGPLGKMIVEADSDGALRGCAGNPSAEAEPVNGKWNVPGILGKAGFLTVTKDLGMGGEPYRGMVQLQTSEIGDDLALYLTESEQIPSAVGLGVSVNPDGSIALCGGFLIQALPNADEAEINDLMERITKLRPISELLEIGGPELLLAELMPDSPYTILEKKEQRFECGCSEEKVERALQTLGREVLEEILEKGETTDITCEFCRRPYHFDNNRLKRIYEICKVQTPE